MFEKFTENAIKAIMHSREEARRLEFGYVQIEHLFLGILHDRIGISALVLSKLGVDLRKARRIVERLIGRAYSNTPLEKVSFAINVMEIISNSVTLAASLGKETVLVEHILLAMLKSNNPSFIKVLSELNLEPEDIETEIKIFWQQDEEIDLPENMAATLPEHYSPKLLTAISKSILDDAREETIKQGHIFIGTEQILLSMTKKKFNCLAGRILERFGLDENSIRVEIHRIIGNGSGTNLDLLEHTSIVEKSLEYSWLEARRFKYGRIGSGHLLAGITTMDNCTSSHMLKYLSIDPEQIRWEVIHLLKNNPETPEPVLTLEQIEQSVNPAAINNAENPGDFIDPDYDNLPRDFLKVDKNSEG
jgi:ATP-dependent Clp protease ATP-binding subunit ClpA